jgi:phenylalanine-4-hydroxylase
MKDLPYRKFTFEEHETWQKLFTNQEPLRDQQIHGLFSEGIRALGISAGQVPDIYELNKKLQNTTGFAGIPVEGLEEDISFFEMLSKRKFPIGNFIREAKDISYTPAPDVFHDLYGHMPFFIDEDYASFCEDLGRRATRWSNRPEVIRQFSRLFWFAIEFSLIKTSQGKRIFGAGIASSHGECRYALSNEPEVIPFDIDLIRNQDFKIDEFQKKLFILEDTQQLYSCLPEFERRAALS